MGESEPSEKFSSYSGKLAENMTMPKIAGDLSQCEKSAASANLRPIARYAAFLSTPGL
jgi:hypothetical protein